MDTKYYKVKSGSDTYRKLMEFLKLRKKEADVRNDVIGDFGAEGATGHRNGSISDLGFKSRGEVPKGWRIMGEDERGFIEARPYARGAANKEILKRFSECAVRGTNELTELIAGSDWAFADFSGPGVRIPKIGLSRFKRTLVLECPDMKASGGWEAAKDVDLIPLKHSEFYRLKEKSES